MSWGFVRGESIALDTLVERLGGNKQSGVIPSKREPIVILINDPRSKKTYKNRWRDDGIFEFYAQGRIDDQTWTSNNRAIRDHFADGRSLLLFETHGIKKRFVGEFMVIGVIERMDLDESKPPKMRRVFVFELEQIDAQETQLLESVPDTSDDLAVLRRRAYKAAEEMKDPRTGSRTVYHRSKDVHHYVLARAKDHCESSACGEPGPFPRLDGKLYLEAHHTIRRCDAGPDSPDHVIALCPNCHRRVHFGADGAVYNKQLKIDAANIERERT